MAAIYRQRKSPLTRESRWSVEAGELVRRSGSRERRWPLAALSRMTLTRQVNPYGEDLRAVRLQFVQQGPSHRVAAFSSLSWQGAARPADQTAAFAAFIQLLCATAADLAPGARFERGEGRAPGRGLAYGAAALLGLGTAAILAVAGSAGAWAMGLDLAARLLFMLILLAAAMPWLPAGHGRAFDPLQLPPDWV